MLGRRSRQREEALVADLASIRAEIVALEIPTAREVERAEQVAAMQAAMHALDQRLAIVEEKAGKAESQSDALGELASFSPSEFKARLKDQDQQIARMRSLLESLERQIRLNEAHMAHIAAMLVRVSGQPIAPDEGRIVD